jgi:hypothetical protein
VPPFGQQVHVEFAKKQPVAVWILGDLDLFAAMLVGPGNAQTVTRPFGQHRLAADE